MNLHKSKLFGSSPGYWSDFDRYHTHVANVRFLCDFGRHGWRSHGTLRAWTHPYSSFERISGWWFPAVQRMWKAIGIILPAVENQRWLKPPTPLIPIDDCWLGTNFHNVEGKEMRLSYLTVLYSPVWLAKYICHHQPNSGYNVFSAFISPSHWWVTPFQTILSAILLCIYICI